jgi:membrane protein required for colicin V production
MTAVDYILIAVILLSVVFGAIRGFLRESIALLAWLVGLWIAWKYSGLLEPHLGGALAGTALQSWVARGILLIAVVIFGWLLAGLLSYLVQRSGLSLGLDRMLGSVFGLVRGAVIAGFAVMLGQAAELDSESWWRGSALMPAAVEMAGVLRSYVETGKHLVDASAEGT